ncbi:hypothetical protein D9M71_844610 [compost metagenome]
MPSPKAIAWSVRLMASRIEPSAARPSNHSASSSNGTFSTPSTWVKCSTTRSGVMFFRENCRHRDRIVAGSFCGSVVARMNLT